MQALSLWPLKLALPTKIILTNAENCILGLLRAKCPVYIQLSFGSLLDKGSIFVFKRHYYTSLWKYD